MLTPDSITRAIRSVCEQEPRIRIAYLFGSHVSKTIHPKSDIDIAMFLDRKMTKNERYRFLVQMYEIFGRSLGANGDQVDIAVLNDASILLRYNVFCEHILLYEADRMERILYECAVWREYEDQEYALKQRLRLMLPRIVAKNNSRSSV